MDLQWAQATDEQDIKQQNIHTSCVVDCERNCSYSPRESLVGN